MKLNLILVLALGNGRIGADYWEVEWRFSGGESF